MEWKKYTKEEFIKKYDHPSALGIYYMFSKLKKSKKEYNNKYINISKQYPNIIEIKNTYEPNNILVEIKNNIPDISYEKYKYTEINDISLHNKIMYEYSRFKDEIILYPDLNKSEEILMLTPFKNKKLKTPILKIMKNKSKITNEMKENLTDQYKKSYVAVYSSHTSLTEKESIKEISNHISKLIYYNRILDTKYRDVLNFHIQSIDYISGVLYNNFMKNDNSELLGIFQIAALYSLLAWLIIKNKIKIDMNNTIIKQCEQKGDTLIKKMINLFKCLIRGNYADLYNIFTDKYKGKWDKTLLYIYNYYEGNIFVSKKNDISDLIYDRLKDEKIEKPENKIDFENLPQHLKYYGNFQDYIKYIYAFYKNNLIFNNVIISLEKKNKLYWNILEHNDYNYLKYDENGKHHKFNRNGICTICEKKKIDLYEKSIVMTTEEYEKLKKKVEKNKLEKWKIEHCEDGKKHLFLNGICLICGKKISDINNKYTIIKREETLESEEIISDEPNNINIIVDPKILNKLSGEINLSLIKSNINNIGFKKNDEEYEKKYNISSSIYTEKFINDSFNKIIDTLRHNFITDFIKIYNIIKYNSYLEEYEIDEFYWKNKDKLINNFVMKDDINYVLEKIKTEVEKKLFESIFMQHLFLSKILDAKISDTVATKISDQYMNILRYEFQNLLSDKERKLYGLDNANLKQEEKNKIIDKIMEDRNEIMDESYDEDFIEDKSGGLSFEVDYKNDDFNDDD